MLREGGGERAIVSGWRVFWGFFLYDFALHLHHPLQDAQPEPNTAEQLQLLLFLLAALTHPILTALLTMMRNLWLEVVFFKQTIVHFFNF